MYPAKLKQFCGAKLPVKDKLIRQGYRESCARSFFSYPKGFVDAVLKHEQIWLREETADYIYHKMTSLTIRYRRGQRPFLDEIVDRCVRRCTSERAKLIAILRFVRDLPRAAHPTQPRFHGGDEEAVIRKQSGMCNEQARVLGILCQIAGLPSRYIGHYGRYVSDTLEYLPGHGINEIYLEGTWAYVDIRGKFFIKSDKTFASTWDLLQDPSLVFQQPKWVLKEQYRGYAAGDDDFFLPHRITVVNNYYASDYARYGYGWVWRTPEYEAKVAAFLDKTHAQHTASLRK